MSAGSGFVSTLALEKEGDNLPPLEILQNRWYNSLTTNLQLDRRLFQIRNPVNPMIQSTEELWNLLDCVPPLSLTFRSPAKRLSDEYISLISQFQYPESTLRETIGDINHEKWLQYLQRLYPPPPESRLPALFRQWAILTAPSIMSAGVAKLSQTLILNRTLHSLKEYQDPHKKQIDFSPDLAQAKDIVEHSMGFSFAFDSVSSPGNVEDTWAGGVNEVPDVSRHFALGPVTVDISAKSYAVCTVVPGPWYSSALLNAGYANQSGPPWPPNPNPTWQDRFGPNGTLRRGIIGIVLADGVTATVRSGAHFTEADRRSIQDNASKGLWPLYIPASNVVTFDGDNSLTIETITQPGIPVVLGNNVMEIGHYLGHAVP